ncbi:MAG: DUF2460 domain-containing protein [Hyphomonas sp.]|nr:DUF2460 domain-containing protein [Hyphomonas sp.]
MTGFHDVDFPIKLALGAVGGPEWKTEIASLASGKEVRNAKWSSSKRRWDVGSAVSSLADLQTLVGFFEARMGRLYGFRFRDPLDHTSAEPGAEVGSEDQFLGIGDGSQSVFQLCKHYGDWTRAISKPVPGTVRVSIDGVEHVSGWTLDTDSSEVRFSLAPTVGAEIRAGFEFDCPVRFENDQINGVIEAFGAGRIVSVALVELF